METGRYGRRLGTALIAASLGCAAWSATVASAATTTHAFEGTERTFTVPPGVTSLRVVATGGAGRGR